MKNSFFTKTTNSNANSNNATLDASNVLINGQSLTNTVNQLISVNNTEDLAIAGCATIAGNNTFTGTNTMPALSIPSAMSVSSNAISLSQLPRLSSTIEPTDPKDLSTKSYIDSSISAIPNLLTSNNSWSGTNVFDTSLPTSSINAVNANDLTRKGYTDLAINANVTALKSGANDWTGSNTFNTTLPTSTKTPSTSTQLTTKTYVDTTTTTAITNMKSGNNDFTGNNSFSNKIA